VARLLISTTGRLWLILRPLLASFVAQIPPGLFFFFFARRVLFDVPFPLLFFATGRSAIFSQRLISCRILFPPFRYFFPTLFVHLNPPFLLGISVRPRFPFVCLIFFCLHSLALTPGLQLWLPRWSQSKPRFPSALVRCLAAPFVFFSWSFKKKKPTPLVPCTPPPRSTTYPLPPQGRVFLHPVPTPNASIPSAVLRIL